MSGIFLRKHQRRSLRRAIRLTCQVVRERGFTLIGEQTIDLSPAGMLVASDANVLTGEDVLVSFRAPFTRIWIDAEAVVARVVHGRRPNDLGRGLGLQFVGLDDSLRALLDAQLHGLPPPLPTRTPAAGLFVAVGPRSVVAMPQNV